MATYKFEDIKSFVVSKNTKSNASLKDAQKVLAYFKRLGVYDFDVVYLNPTVSGFLAVDLIPVTDVEGFTDVEVANLVLKRKSGVDTFNVAAILARLKNWQIDIATKMQMAEFGVEFGPLPSEPEELVLEFRAWLGDLYNNVA